MDRKTLGRRIVELRTARHLSSPQLAKLADLDRSDMWRIENGQGPQSIGLDRLERIAKALGVTLADLLDVSRSRRTAPRRLSVHPSHA